MAQIDPKYPQRRANHFFYKELFQDIEGVAIFEEPSDHYFSNHWLTAVVIDPKITGGVSRETLRKRLLDDNIESRPLWKPMHLQPIFKGQNYFGGEISEILFRDGLCLPSGSDMADNERERIAETISNVFKKVESI